MKTSLKDCPSVHQVLLEVKQDIYVHEDYIKFIINSELSKIRDTIKKGKLSKTKDELVKYIVSQVWLRSAPNLVNIINGTGIVLHTGFGRAPFHGKQLKNLANRLDGYVNLEFDLESGNRGDRQSLIHDRLSAMCGSESALLVNNNAAAVFLALNEMAINGDVICSRGQMVEIGGSFRIPDIIEKSGAKIKEVGATNRTHLKDYENAISKKTKLILWVHTSNYIVKGFTKEVSLSDLVLLGQKYKIPVMADLGSGAFLDMQKLGLADEIPVKSIVNVGPDITTFSGDKLLGGPQSGLIVGSKKWINAFKKNPLYRVLRSDKITIGLLEETLRSYHSGSFSKDNLSLKMLTTSRKTLSARGQKILNHLDKKVIRELGIDLKNSEVEAGSGSLPEDKIESVALTFSPKNYKVKDIAKAFRCGSIPVVGYIQKNTFYIDLKAVLPNQVTRLASAIQEI
ncbi:MAG: L-seryl-tRNA(Sec) selenium transferase [Candidatus Marinimicrobia bacterium]|jgi:L-seryl-tRNA(Ser) seleniumtransferase|nr:L-seryl-tRNA(Sec) selenium transferase [Candidatus Neomarinimicrobiota bacterium]MBT3502425.1 L-seryl-tRNA(Sec) selenium transferase [Candidatus Neomarinimicrobiota bacterium]MBT3838777.1 L-seryl-tRNA(Sec) selenium transferase [Candidatus Neomarinimicrobiota bacterium]MBT3999649.1 L-seryl-tRNA(Sec) selenium transferase [Candidatus Neomarinimicrobiota bacterium]MBT4578786.1 L-seryl-tRNA(Sec) selenium transferase [Candidatus Neomarinimicrobiota bacterium]